MRRLFLGILLVGVVWAVGLAAFIAGLPKPAAATSEYDGVIVYTGGGGARIAAAMTLFADGAGQRLLISGVHPDITKDGLAGLWKGAPELFDCCVDLGHRAQSTEGNASEAAEWALVHKFRRVVLVTSDYHMPRAIVATRARLKDAEITPYAVASGYLDERGRPASADAWRQIAGEYAKYLLARSKALFSFVEF